MSSVVRYTVALIGCGRVAEKHLKALHHNANRLKLAAVVDFNPDAARKRLHAHFAGTGEAVPVYESVDALLQDLKPDIAAITTPSGTHYDIAKEMIENRINVFIEKPMTLDVVQARELVALAEENTVHIIMGHIYRYLPLVDLIHDDIAAGRLGKVYSGDVKVRWGHNQEYYNLAPWRGTWAQDGGVLMNQTVHACDLMCWLMDDDPVRVSGIIRQMSHSMEAEDHGAATLEMASGAILMVEGTTNNSPRNRGASFYIITEEMEIEAGILSGKIKFKMTNHEGKVVTRKYIGRLLRQLRKNGGLKALKRMLNPHSGIYYDLVNSLDNDTQPRADGNSGVQSVETILAIYKSAKSDGEPVSIPLNDFKLADMEGYFDN